MVYVHQLPLANAGDDEGICFGDDVTLTATGGTTYNWNTGDNTANITVSPGTDTEYIVTVEDAWGCLDSDTVNVTVNPLPDAQAGEDQDICLGETATLTASNGKQLPLEHRGRSAKHTGQPGNIHRVHCYRHGRKPLLGQPIP